MKTNFVRGQISKAEFYQMRSKNVKLVRVHVLPKTHKAFTNIPKFRSVINTTGSSHYLVWKYLTQLLYPLTNNEFSLKDSFEVVNRIQDIPSSFFVNGYQYVPFDVEVLFTNAYIKKTIDIILTRIYNDDTISTISKIFH